MIERALLSVLKGRLFGQKAIVIMGARQTGKTTLIKQLTGEQKDVLWLNADSAIVRQQLENLSVAKWASIIGKSKIVVIDEAQRIEDIGLKAKLFVDNFTDIQLILTGSSSFELSNKINEPLTGRKWEYQLFPLSFGELRDSNGLIAELENLPVRLVYGSYPDVINNKADAKEILTLITDSYLYKDVLEWERIKKPDKLVKLLQALAYQVGNLVTFSEIGQLVGLDNETVEKYIVLLEQARVVFRLGSYSRNLRNELKFSRKIYFYDNGVRNALINNFTDIDLRSDNGALWENWIVSEFRKKNCYAGNYVSSYFWRTTDKKEIDCLEESNGVLKAYEFKWNPKKKSRQPSSFRDSYPDTEIITINPMNFYEYL